jgi:kynurenine formamidase
MLIDLTVIIDKHVVAGMTVPSKLGHLGTHFDVMEKEFPLECVKRVGRLVDVSAIRGREVEVGDIQSPVGSGEFVIFRTNYALEIGYGGPEYNHKSAELSDDLVTYLLEQGVSLIGVDAASIQKPAKHFQVDQRCAARNVFIVENLCNLDKLAQVVGNSTFVVYCAPLNFRGLSGLPCRVVAEVSPSEAS